LGGFFVAHPQDDEHFHALELLEITLLLLRKLNCFTYDGILDGGRYNCLRLLSVRPIQVTFGGLEEMKISLNVAR
jgi:hypothetical protein